MSDLNRAVKYLRRVAANGPLILWVGTKPQSSASVMREAQRCGMPYVNHRWLGGTLTNFNIIRNRLGRLEKLEEAVNAREITKSSEEAQLDGNREYRKMYRNLNGIRAMNRLPECLVIVDPKKEHNAVREAKKMGISTVALIDTDSDPDEVDLPITCADGSIERVMSRLADAIVDGKQGAGTDDET